MLRAIILSLVFVAGLGLLIPLASDDAEAGSGVAQKQQDKEKRRAKKYGKYYHAKSLKTQRALQARKKMAQKKLAAKRALSKKRLSARNKSVGKRSYAAKQKLAAKKRFAKGKASSTKKSFSASQNRKRATAQIAKKKYSASWLRNYRAKKARQNELAKAKRAVRLRTIRVNKSNRVISNPSLARIRPKPSITKIVESIEENAQLNGESRVSQNSKVPNSAEFGRFEIFGPAVGETSSSFGNDTVGGVSTTSLRRSVINEMITENGWVENDFEKEIAGKKVYVVVAKAPDKNNHVKDRIYYFTESNGSIYRLATKSTEEETKQVAELSEKAIETLQNESSKTQQAKNKD